MKNIEKSLNLVYYYLCKLSYAFGKFLLVYDNPFLWMANASKLKFGFKIFCLHMEKNHSTFINSCRRLVYVLKIWHGLMFYTGFSLSNAMLYTLGFDGFAPYLPLAVGVFTSMYSDFLVFKKGHYLAYFKSFELEKKQIHPLLLALMLLVYVAILTTLMLFSVD